MHLIERKFTPVERSMRLSESIIWRWQRRYFEDQGIAAWNQGTVPHHVSSSPHMADAYAHLVLGFLRDCAAGQPDASQPVYVVELGSGSGRLGYRMLLRLRRLMRGVRLSGLRVTYVMSDFTAGACDYWRAHTALQKFIAEGSLDVARFDMQRDELLQLEVSGHVLDASTLRNPLIVVASYVFDSLPQDAFQLAEGGLYELLATVSSPRKETDGNDPDILTRAECNFEPEQANTAPYPDEDWNALIDDYRARMPDLAFTFPVTALRCIGRLEQLSGGRMLLLSADRGYHTDAALAAGAGTPRFAAHGSVSMLVDYQLIGAYVDRRGGLARHPAHAHRALSVSAFLLGYDSEQAAETLQAYDEMVERFGPDDFATLKEGVESGNDQFTLDETLAFLRLSRWDHLRFLHALPRLREGLGSYTAEQSQSIAAAAHATWQHYFPIGDLEDLAFDIATPLLDMGLYEDALSFFQQSADLYGMEVGTAFNLGLCHLGLGEDSRALICIEQALQLDPGMSQARQLRVSLTTAVAVQAITR